MSYKLHNYKIKFKYKLIKIVCKLPTMVYVAPSPKTDIVHCGQSESRASHCPWAYLFDP